ncbi:hypothetical protein B7494_g3699 [Chlorociboria aeruginascens]|nr:hypothetical protein B7494_g3699 [Chlorociboria aeruginascens]
MTSRRDRDKDKDAHTKKVHYTSSTKGSTTPTHRSRHSHDSGLGTSSDRASVGRSPSPTTQQQLASVMEALSAADAKIQKLELLQQDLNEMLAQGNRENKALKKEIGDLVTENEVLRREVAEQRKVSERLRRERDAVVEKESVREKEERRWRDEEKEKEAKKKKQYEKENSNRMKRDSWKEMPVPLYEDAPPAPRRMDDEYSSARPPSERAPKPPNPFLPNPLLNPTYGGGGRAMPPSSVAYAPTAISYSTAPVFDERRAGIMGRELDRYDDRLFPVDGNYHPYPL